MRKTFAAVGQVGSPSLVGGGGGPSYLAEYQAVYDQFATKPSDADATAQEAFVQTGVTDGWWSKLDRMFILASHASGADSMLDWIHPTGTSATIVNAPTWTQYQGYLGNGTSSYIDTNYNPYTDASNYTQTAFSIHHYSRTDLMELTYDWALQDILVDPFIRTTLLPWYTIDAGKGAQWYANNNTARNASPRATLGMIELLRLDNTNVELYYDGVYKGGTTLPSTGIPNGPFFIMSRSDNGNPVLFCNRQISFWAVGNLDLTDRASFQPAFDTLMTYYGTQV